jgi:hypothetical protein
MFGRIPDLSMDLNVGHPAYKKDVIHGDILSVCLLLLIECYGFILLFCSAAYSGFNIWPSLCGLGFEEE